MCSSDLNHETLTDVAKTLDKGDIDGLYAAVGEGHVSAQHVVDTLVSALGGEAGTEETLAEGVLPTKAARVHQRARSDSGVVIEGMDEGDVILPLYLITYNYIRVFIFNSLSHKDTNTLTNRQDMNR